LETGIIDVENQEEDGWKEEPTLYTQQVLFVPSVENLYYNDLKYYIHMVQLWTISMQIKREL
jgi:hypothetical protein